MSWTVPFVVHGEVWLLVLGTVALGAYTARVVQPRAVAIGYPPITAFQRSSFVAAVLLMWLASDYPVHDVAESYLYFVHMIQHMLLSMIIPALFVWSTPRWLVELVVGVDSSAWRALRWLVRPVPALVIFNGLTVILHFPVTVEASAQSGALHFVLHLLVFAAGLIMWTPIIGPVQEWRYPPLGQCLYLFAMSIVPTVPSGFLVFAERVVYPHYSEAPVRLFGLSVFTDQTAAGIIMKLVGGFFLWAVIVVIFGRWVSQEMSRDRLDREARARAGASRLTYEDVAEHFSRSPAPTEG